MTILLTYNDNSVTATLSISDSLVQESLFLEGTTLTVKISFHLTFSFDQGIRCRCYRVTHLVDENLQLT